jgi:hypothetical protein
MTHTETRSGKEAMVGIMLILGTIAVLMVVSSVINKPKSKQTTSEK